MDWKRILDFTKTEVLGLDIGSSTVKVVQLYKDDSGYAVTAAGIAEIAASEDDNNHRKINTVKAIRECFESVPGMTKMAVCGLSGPEVAVRDFEFPSLTTSELGGAVMFEASQVCPFNAAESAIDYHLIPATTIRHFFRFVLVLIFSLLKFISFYLSSFTSLSSLVGSTLN